ncbi:LTA synthase family protein [Lactococcus garvieae]|uniref:LTA synthase family protein n=1 Tax=Lactococcus garvieae TaxID=1363 RepID=UPI0030D5ED72
MQKYSNISKKERILQIIAIFSLFIGLSSVNVEHVLPEGVSYSTPVSFLLLAYRIVGFFSLVYLALIFVKNKDIWMMQVAGRSKGENKLLDWKRIIAVPCVLIAYYLFHLSMILVENINNAAFRADYISLNLNLLVERYFPLACVLLLAIGLVTHIPENKKLKKVSNIAADIKVEHFYMALLTSVAFLDHMTRRLVWNTGFGPTNSAGNLRLVYVANNIVGRDDFLRLYGNFLFAFIVICVLSYFIVKGVQAFKANKVNCSMALTSSLLLALIFNYFIQASMRVEAAPMIYGYVVAGVSLFQILVLTLIFMAIYLLLNRYMIATAVIILVFGSFTVGNAIKFSERQEPVYVSELSWLMNLKTLLSFVDLKLVAVAATVLLVLVTLVILLSRKFFKGKIMSWKERGWTAIILIVLAFPLVQNFRNFTSPDKQINVPILTQYIKVSNGDILWKGSPNIARAKSLSYVWVKQIFGKAMDEPEGYSQAKIQEIVQKYSDEAEKINKNRSSQITDQTVIYLLSESLSNPNRVQGATLSENPLKNIDEIKASSTGGLMYSNGFAGGTANMEAQTLSGLPKVNFSSNISTINSDVFPSMPFIPSISNYFPEKIALHPENATNYNRNSIYNKLGFDHFYALSGTDKADLLTNQETLDGKVSDAQTYRDVLDKIDPSKSQFFSVLTMQNHMPYTSYSGSSTITASGEGYSEAQNQLLENYVRKISDTDKATKEFLTELEKIDKKITLVFYGDHLSNVFPSDYAGFKEDPLNAYKTDYFIWTNKGNTTDKQVDLSSATFTPALFEATGSKVSPYYALLSDVMWEVPAAYNSPLSSTVTLTEEQSKRMEDLKLVQYDLTSGKHYLKEDSPFFKLEK